MNKVYRLLALVLIAAFVLSACAQPVAPAATQEQAAQPGGKVEFWYPFGGDSETFYLKLVEQFNEQFPECQVEPTYVEGGGLESGKLLAAIAAGTPPDLVMGTNFALVYGLIAQGAVEPLDGYMESVGLDPAKDIIPPYRKMLSSDGKLYLLPEVGQVVLTYYNKAMLEEAGLSTTDLPRTIEELDVYAKALTKVDENGEITRMGMIPWLGEPGWNPFLYPYMAGADLYDESNKKLSIDNDAFKTILNWYRDYAKEFDAQKIQSFSSNFGGVASADHPFFTDAVGIFTVGNWFTNFARIYDPDLEYVVGPVVVPAGGAREGASVTGGNAFVVPKGAKSPECAVKFAHWTSSGQQILENANTWHTFSVYTTPVEGIVWAENGDPAWKLQMEMLENPGTGNVVLPPNATKVRDELNAVIQKVIYDQADPAALLADLEARMQADLDSQLNK